MGENETLNKNHRRAIAALIEHATVQDAAEACGLSPTTIYRYLQDLAFRAELSQHEGEAIDAATRRLLGLVDSAVETLRQVLQDKEAGYSHRLRAAQTVLDQLMKLRELRNIEERITKLERQVFNETQD